MIAQELKEQGLVSSTIITVAQKLSEYIRDEKKRFKWNFFRGGWKGGRRLESKCFCGSILESRTSVLRVPPLSIFVLFFL